MSSVDGFLVSTAQGEGVRARVLYARVSSAKQRNDLERQQQFLRDHLPDQHPGPCYDISDVGSGLNFKRPGLLRLLGLVKAGSVREIVVASRDRLARFGFELIEWLCSECSTKLVVLDNSDCAPEDELGKDLMAIVQVYCCRWNGRSRYRAPALTASGHTGEDAEVEALPDGPTEGKTRTVGRVQPVHLQPGSVGPARRGKHPKGPLQDT